jgi:hypothetical protein
MKESWLMVFLEVVGPEFEEVSQALAATPSFSKAEATDLFQCQDLHRYHLNTI